MITKLRKRIESEKGFTLIEMLIVIIILGILIAIAVPAYLKFRDNANESAVQANIRAAIPAMEEWNAKNTGAADDIDTNAATSGYQGMTAALLRSKIDAALKEGTAFNVKAAGVSTYCVESSLNSKKAHKKETTDITLGALCP